MINKIELFKKYGFKDKLKFLSPLFFGIGFFLLSVFFDKSASLFNIDSDHGIDVEHIENILHRKEKKINTLLTKLSIKFSEVDNRFIVDDSRNESSYDSIFFTDKYLSLNKEDINLLVYKNDSLKYWTSNLIPLNLRYSESYLGDRVVDLNNAIYRVIIQKKAKYIFVGLILIKHKYPYVNSLLKNSYLKELDLSDDIQISLLKENYGVHISDSNKNFLFTLLPSQSSVTEKPFFYTSVFLYLIGVVFFLYFVNSLIKKMFLFTRNDIWLLFLIIGLLYVKYLLTYYQIPTNVYFTDLYKPDLFAYSDFLPSLSEFLQLSIILFFVSFNFVKVVDNERFTRKVLSLQRKSNFFLRNLRYIFIYGFPVLLAFAYLLILQLIKIIIVNSTIPFEIYKILTLGLYSFIGLVIIALLISSFVIALHKYIHLCSKLIEIKGFLYAVIILLVVYISADFYLNNTANIQSIIYLTLLVFLFLFVKFSNLFYPYYFYLFILFISTLFIIFYVDLFINEKDLEIRNTLILPAMAEQDPVAEHILTELTEKIQNDKKISQIIFNGENVRENLKNHLYKKHYPVLWEEYDLELSICSKTDSVLFNENIKYNCNEYYESLLRNQGIEIENSAFNFLDNENGRITYLGFFEYYDKKKNKKIKLYLELNSKLRSKVIGFPKILIDESYYRKSRLEEYSYAKYIKNHLVNQKGTFEYKYNLNDYNITKSDSSVFQLDGYQHLLKRNPNGYSVIISRKYRTTLDLLVSLSYIFVLYYIFLNLVLIINKIPFYYKEFRHGLKFRIQFSMVAILFLSILTIGSLSIYYIIKQSERNYNKKVKVDIRSVINELEYEFDNHLSIDSIPKQDIYRVLRRISNIFATDIHMFSTKGDLIASSIPEIFERQLIGRKIDPVAYKNLKIGGDNYFNTDEKISDLEYLSAYAKLVNIDNTTLAYINMPFFSKEKILQEEVSNFVVSVINIFALLLLVAIVIAIFISNKIVQPLRLVQSKFSEVQLGKTNEQILYSRDDEIGGLIKEYNRMLLELAKSARMIGKSEREGAWREMAKQIAHEIKNPLTPMKLNLQLLKKSWVDSDPDFPLRIDSVSNTLIQQIDRLSAIATSFSNFAKIPSAKNKKFNLRQTIESALLLFENLEDLTLSSNIDENTNDFFVYADEEQISRAIINLIKNAHQARKIGIDSFIYIEIIKNFERVIIKITDNGTGIPDELKEKLFTPNFTTKTSGMGLGLSIVKNIIENAQGKVWFVTELNVGTSFYVQLPIYNQENRI